MNQPLSEVSGRSQDKPTDEREEERVAEPTFKEIRTSEEEIRQGVRAKLERKLDGVRKQREKDALLGVGPPTDRIAIDAIKGVAMDTKRGDLPEEIAVLPAHHPTRIRWEKGYRQRKDGSWFRVSAPTVEERRRIRIVNELKSRFSMIFVLLVIILSPVAFSAYYNEWTEVREKIFTSLENKGIPQDDPWILREHGVVSQVKWLPTLYKILEEVEKLPKSLSLFPGNPEPGSYLNYITKHNKKFDPEEAMDWDSRMMRKSSQSFSHD